MRTRALLVLLVPVVAACERGGTSVAPSHLARAPRPGTPIGMAELHRSGGVPPRWRFSLPPGDVEAGRRAFGDLGCPSCHAVSGTPAAGEPQSAPGPDLAGMGGHHPAEYFAESILNPDAVVVTGPGYVGPDGRSIMPTYPDLTMAQLADLVAYLKSLRADAAAEMMEMAAAPVRSAAELPPPPAHPGTIFYVQVYDVQGGQLDDFERWFRSEGAPAFLAYEGAVGVDTYVDVTRDGPALATIMSFRDDQALKRFLDDPAGSGLKTRFDEYVGPHQHRVFRTLPAYRVESLSATR
jgi:mono/diheme cytochrome c family protein